VPIIYYIFLVSFLGFPFLGIILSGYLKFNWSSKFIKLIIIFFVVHNLLFLFGYSLKGDYIDYTIFSIEYLFLCFLTFGEYKSRSNYFKIFKVVGIVSISLGIIIGTVGIFMFPAISQDYETDKTFHFISNDKIYETRRFSFGTVGSIDTRYTFETYRDFNYLPIENKVDKTDFFETKTDLDISEQGLKISILDSGIAEQIIFKSSNGKFFLKSIN